MVDVEHHTLDKKERNRLMDSFRVLIIDDEEELVSTLVERLEIRGCEAVGVHCGKEAIERLGESQFDVVILDVRLPGENGVEIMRNIKCIHQDLPVILLTGHMCQETSEEGMRAGAIDYIIKPININELIKKMKEAIAARRENA